MQAELKFSQECLGLAEIRDEAKIQARAVDSAKTVVLTAAYWCLLPRVQETWGCDSTSQNLWQISYISPGTLQKVALWWQMHESDYQIVISVKIFLYINLHISIKV